MRFFQEKLSTMVPVIKRMLRLSSETGAKCQYAYLERMPEEKCFELPYLKPVAEFGAQSDGIEEKRIFLVAEEENIAIKAALGVMIYPFYENKEEICMQLEEAGYQSEGLQLVGQDGQQLHLRLIHLEGERKNESTMLNPFLPLAAGVHPNDSVFFWGLTDDNNLPEKLDIIMGCNASIQFVMVSEAQLGTPWLRELMMERDFEIIRLPKLKAEYYEKVFQELLTDERYQLAENLSVGGLVRSFQKKRGERFAEEDIAWSLDQAIQTAKHKENKYVLERVDFALEQLEECSPLLRLRGMTGLEEMKSMALECAALSQEQVRNPKLKEICKHAIFKGRPGTGKTMCGELLAQIIAEQGQSNGAFVVASRKDIIGQYLGHTAPKVAKLFERARNGVLFVDEAGFLLHDTHNGYTQEAIKEFVRYMELYQDVMVIFALYPHEVEDWMQLDAGLSSRIGRVVEFSDYTEEELIQIAKSMCNDRGYEMAENAPEFIADYIKNRKMQLKDNFGNAREMRKLVESAILARSVRYFEKTPKEKKPLLSAVDFENGSYRLNQEGVRKKARIGFVLSGGEACE